MENQEGSELTNEERLAKWQRTNIVIGTLFLLPWMVSITLWCAGILPVLPEWLRSLFLGLFLLSYGGNGFCKPLPSGSDAGSGDKRKRNLLAAALTIAGLVQLTQAVMLFLELGPLF